MRKKEKIKTNEKKKTLFKYTVLEKIAFGHVPVEREKIFPWGQGAGGGKREEKVAYKLLLTQSFISKDPRSSLGH